MADFDPAALIDKIKSKQDGAVNQPRVFNPDDVIAGLERDIQPPAEEQYKYGPVEAALGGGVQGYSYGYADDAGGAALAAWDYITGKTDEFEYRKNQKMLEEQFSQMQQQQPGAYISGEIAGGLVSPVNKVLAPIAAAKRLGKAALPVAAAVGGGIAAAGLSEGTLEGDPSMLATDIGLGTVAAPLFSAGVSKALKGVAKSGKFAGNITGKAWKKLVPDEKAKALQKWGTIKVANVAANLPEEWAEYIYKNPDRFDNIPQSAEDLGEVLISKINMLRKDTDEIEKRALSLLSDKATVHYPSIKKVITKTVNEFDLNPSSETGARTLKAIDTLRNVLDYRYGEAIRAGGPKDKLSQKILKKAIIDNSEDIWKLKQDFTLGKETAMMRTLDSRLRSALEKNVLTKTPESAEYKELMKKAAEGEKLWKNLTRYFKPERPTSGKGTRSKLEMSKITLDRVKSLPKRKIGMKMLNDLDDKLGKEIIESDIWRRTQGGVQSGSRNVQGYSKVVESLGATAGSVFGAGAAGAAGVAPGAITGYLAGQAAGTLLGMVTDKYGRRIAKNLVMTFSPHAGGEKALERVLEKGGPEFTDTLIKYMQAGEGARAVQLLNSIQSFQD